MLSPTPAIRRRLVGIWAPIFQHKQSAQDKARAPYPGGSRAAPQTAPREPGCSCLTWSHTLHDRDHQLPILRNQTEGHVCPQGRHYCTSEAPDSFRNPDPWGLVTGEAQGVLCSSLTARPHSPPGADGSGHQVGAAVLSGPDRGGLAPRKASLAGRAAWRRGGSWRPWSRGAGCWGAAA